MPQYPVASWSIQLFGHNTPTLQTDRADRQDNGPIASGGPFYKRSPKNAAIVKQSWRQQDIWNFLDCVGFSNELHRKDWTERDDYLKEVGVSPSQNSTILHDLAQSSGWVLNIFRLFHHRTSMGLNCATVQIVDVTSTFDNLVYSTWPSLSHNRLSLSTVITACISGDLKNLLSAFQRPSSCVVLFT